MEPGAHHYRQKILLTLFSLGIVCALGYLGYQNYLLKQTKISLETELTNTKQDFASTTQKLTHDLDALRDFLLKTQGERVSAEQDARKRQEMLDAMSGILGTYEKLANIDEELLAKYSKVYFLSENYTPKYSIIIPAIYTFVSSTPTETEKMISNDVWPFLSELLDNARARNIDLKIISAFRSFDTQSKLKTAYTVTFGTNSSSFSADQGYSEHQLGTTVDFTTEKLGADNATFEKTASYTWLIENAYKYGFILSYPKGNVYYIFEPWHWRFVGKSLALRLHNENKNFYDLSQRDINEYLVSLFDK